MGINNFTDLSVIEFKMLYLSNNFTKFIDRTDRITPHYTHLPSSIDWRAEGYVTNVKNQQQCGSCWAFSAVGAIEGQHAKKTGTLVSLSEQNLVDCAGEFGCYGCDGGWPEAAMRYVIHNKGIDTEDSYIYTAMDGVCNYSNSNKGAIISKTVNISRGNMSDLYSAIGNIGPVSVAIDAEYDLQYYKSGIYKSDMCSSNTLNHAVLAVGYSETPNLENKCKSSKTNSKYIIIKNSWGADWGMDGYVYFSTDEDNMCGIAEAASYPIV